MDLHIARRLALSLMAENGLLGWKFRFDRSRRRFGCCNHGRKRISLSAVLTRLNELKDVQDTIAHEVAHALTPGKGHGRVWKRKAVQLGASPERCFDGTVNMPEPTFLGTCPSCGKSVKRFRRSRVACRECCEKHNEGRYSEDYRIVFRRIPRKP